jgi:hypothetical protein
MENEELVRKYLRLLESNCIDEAAYTELLHPVITTIFPRIYARMCYAQGCARVMSFSETEAGKSGVRSMEMLGCAGHGETIVRRMGWLCRRTEMWYTFLRKV